MMDFILAANQIEPLIDFESFFFFFLLEGVVCLFVCLFVCIDFFFVLKFDKKINSK